MFDFKRDDNEENYESRDPKQINRGLKVTFEDVIAEPPGAQSFKYAWTTNRFCFQMTRGIVYAILTFAIAPFVAFSWGFLHALVSFIIIWVVVPSVNLFALSMVPVRRFLRSLSQAMIEPFCEGFGTYWSRIKFQHHYVTHLPKEETEISIV